MPKEHTPLNPMHSQLDLRLQTSAKLVLAVYCGACYDVSSLDDITQHRESCAHCGSPVENFKALLEAAHNLDRLIQNMD